MVATCVRGQKVAWVLRAIPCNFLIDVPSLFLLMGSAASHDPDPSEFRPVLMSHYVAI